LYTFLFPRYSHALDQKNKSGNTGNKEKNHPKSNYLILGLLRGSKMVARVKNKLCVSRNLLDTSE
jgi:hypothetical protein